MSVVELKREADPEIIARLKDVLAMAERGKINDICVVGTINSDGEVFSTVVFEDRFRLIGALHYAMSKAATD